jgi:hypothetical protein
LKICEYGFMLACLFYYVFNKSFGFSLQPWESAR